jgi:hypothetical protein
MVTISACGKHLKTLHETLGKKLFFYKAGAKLFNNGKCVMKKMAMGNQYVIVYVLLP